ncbi:uncharacterized protein ALTATR162_LOCUS11653 [Alternaria atra]|uniref:PQ loop repeat protein n=1 Tax=Alternaria atra TaxID=119953 RepID=A0A8J2ID76_9PLEO|nr:uncharacterized protein ALTATR162_LOCUS11653 [Alternaria atra]CAG5186654.1 unnamed protein product [Alternaria atra]
MLILWSICGVPFGVYAIVQNFNFALKFQPQAFAGLTLIAWGQTLYYHNKWRVWTATLATVALAASFGIMELILILTLRGPYSRGVEWPMMLMAISASVIQVIGLIPPYFELAKRNGRVIGIDFWFLTIDYLGAFFSLMAVVAQQWFDALGASLYIACMVLETGIFASQAIWLWRVRHVRREAKKAGKTYDEYVAENQGKKLPRCGSEETFVDVETGCEKKTTIGGGEYDAGTDAEKATIKASTTQQERTDVTTADATSTSASTLTWTPIFASMTTAPSSDTLQTPLAAVLKTSTSR